VSVDGVVPDIRLLAPVGDVGLASPTIQLAWCDNSTLDSWSRWIKVNGVLKTSSFDYVANSGPADCSVKATSTTSGVALNPGSNQIDAYICDLAGNCTTKTFWITRLLQGVAVRAELPERQHFAATSGSQRFFVKNLHTVATSFTVAPDCAGTASGCAVTPTTLTNVPPGESRVATLTYNVGAAGTAGTAMVKAFDNTFRDSASVAVKAIGAPAPVVSVVDVNPATTLRRDLCVTIAAGSSGAIECGDLRIVHALPTIRTLNKSRTPTLLYNSAHAEPFAVVPGTVTLSSSGSLPDSVEGVIRTNGLAVVTGRWGGSDWTLGATRRIALPWTVSPDTIRPDTVYDYTFEAATIYPAPTGRQATAVNGKLIVLDRRGNGFGAGWSLAGLERIRFLSNGDKLWVGGDGSARVYQSTPDPNAWVAPAEERPDTLKKVGGGQYYRAVRRGVKVWFRATGLHDSTVNRLGQSTKFGYTNGLLTSITLPDTLPSLPGGQVYTFAYDSSAPPKRVVTIRAPGIVRVTTIWLTDDPVGVFRSMRVDSIGDPDNNKVRFTYENGTSRRIASRTDRRGTVTSYNYDVAKKLWRIHTNLQPDSIRLGFTALENQGLSTASPKTAIDTASAYTAFYGPRQYATLPSDSLTQETRFYVDRLGAVRRVRDAHNQWTTVRREDGQWPVLATEIVDASSFVTRAGYDPRGNIIRSVAVNPLGDGRDTVTHYHWNPLWDAVDSIVTPMGLTTTMGYDPTNGNVLWQQVGSDPARRVTFRYGNAQKLLSSTVLPQTPADSIVYDGQWNLAATRTPKGFWTSYYKDALGRDTLVVTPVDSTDFGRGGDADSVFRARQRTTYTVMDRDQITEAIGPNRLEMIHALKGYDEEGNLLSLARFSIPDVTTLPPIGTMTTRWRYDRANRRVAEVAPDDRPGDPRVDSTLYDPAGNPVERISRRVDTTGIHLSDTLTYDALNRLIRRRLPQVSYRSRPTGFNVGGPFPVGGYPAYTIAAETDTFTYDPVGRLLTADNADAKVKRSYYPNGLIKTDSLRIQTVARDDWERHKYGLRYAYDLDGRRDTLIIPQALRPGGDGAITYTYDPQLGVLQTVRDLQGNQYALGHNNRSELTSIDYPGQYREFFSFDVDGRLATDTIQNLGGNVYPRFETTWLRATRYVHDAQGRVRRSVDAVRFKDTLDVSYTGLGHFLSEHLVQHGCGNCRGADTLIRSANFEQAWPQDAMGNRSWHTLCDTVAGSEGCSSTPEYYESGTARLVAAGAASYEYDFAGNNDFYSRMNNNAPSSERRSLYAADGKLRMFDYRWAAEADLSDHDPTQYPQKYAVEDYRYDALGRRIWVRARRWCNDLQPDGYGGTISITWEEATECRVGLLRRTIWDGDQELVEIQMPWAIQYSQDDTTQTPAWWENDASPVSYGSIGTLTTAAGPADPYPYFGHVIYVGGRGVDQPLAITRVNYAMTVDWFSYPRQAISYSLQAPFTIVPLWNARGDAPLAVFSSGWFNLCNPSNSTSACVANGWPWLWSAYDRMRLTAAFWHGTLLEAKRDKSSLSYMRNRYYDPATGRFTQEDPLGLAGGLNLYGFANGDPVNFSDPFGLTCKIRGNCTQSQSGAGGVEVGCRSIHGTGGSVGSHCAIRVGGQEVIELNRREGTDDVEILTYAASDEGANEFEWNEVPTPEGQTLSEFESNVKRAAKHIGPGFEAEPYSSGSRRNSNFFVYSVIKGAGGRVPRRAVGKGGIFNAVGLCGGGGRLAVGDDCPN